MQDQINLKSIQDAQLRIQGDVHRTPVFSSAYLSELSGSRVSLKAELLQKTGSFKPRGAVNKIKTLTAAEKERGIVSVSAGNHAQAVAYACALEKIPCTIVMPVTAPKAKLDATRGYGAEVILHEDMKSIFERTQKILDAKNATLLHPFNDPAVISGQGTVGLEIHEDVPDADVVVIGIGGGALLTGIAVAMKSLKPSIRIVGVEPVGAAGMRRALDQGSPVRLEKIETIADGLAAPYVTDITLSLAQKYVDDVILVTDDEMKDAIRILLQRAKLLTEAAGAAGTAALMSGKIKFPGKNVVLVLSGGNLDLQLLKGWL